MGFSMRVVGALLAMCVTAGAWAQVPADAAKTTLIVPPAPMLASHVGHWGATSSGGGREQELTADHFAEVGCSPILPRVVGVVSTPGPFAPPAPLAPPPVAGDGKTCVAILHEDGLQRWEMARYQAEAGSGELQVFAEQFTDATGAFSAYTYYRSLMKQARPMSGKVGSDAVSDASSTLVLAGTAVLRVTGKVAAEDLVRFTAALPKVGGRNGVAPLLPTMLPEPGLDKASVRYALGPTSYQAMAGVLPAGMLSWDKSAEVATANYAGKGGSKGTLTLLMYPTPQIAGDRGRAIEKEINENGGAAKFGTLKLRRIGPLLGLTTGDFSPEQAASLVGALHLTQDLSYDKPMPLEFHAEVQKTASLLQNIAVLCGVLILAAVLLGVFLGGARAGWRVMHGKPAASEPEFLTISLRDEPKALFVRKDEK